MLAAAALVLALAAVGAAAEAGPLRSIPSALHTAQAAGDEEVLVPAGHYTVEDVQLYFSVNRSARFRAQGGLAVIDCRGEASGLEISLHSDMVVSFSDFEFRNCSSRAEPQGRQHARLWAVGPLAPWCEGCWCSLQLCSKGGAVTITNGSALGELRNVSVTFERCRFVGNSADKGGAVSMGLFTSISDSKFVFEDCLFSGNEARMLGGSAIDIMVATAYNTQYFRYGIPGEYSDRVFVSQSAVELRRCRFEENVAKEEGTVSFWSSAGFISGFNFTADSSTFFHNAGGDGAGVSLHVGGVWSTAMNTFSFSGDVFERNNAGHRTGGGGIFASFPLAELSPSPPRPLFFRSYRHLVQLHIRNSDFIRNTAYTGGAINVANGMHTIDNVRFVDNTAEMTGGAICLGCIGGGDAEILLNRASFQGNTASGFGASFSSESSGAVTVRSSSFDMLGSNQGISDFYFNNAGEVKMDENTKFMCGQDHRMLKSSKTVSWGLTGTLDKRWNAMSLEVRINRMALSCLTCPRGQFTDSRPTLLGPVYLFINSTDNPQDIASNDGRGTFSQQCTQCPNGMYLAEETCTACPAGRSLQGHSADGAEACGSDVVYLLCEAIMAVLFAFLTMLLPMSIGWPVQIEDISWESGRVVVATCGPHRILRVPWAQVRVNFKNTGLPFLDSKSSGGEATTSFCVEALDSERLVLLSDIESLGALRIDSSMGSLRVDFWRACLCTGVQQVPAIAMLQALILAAAATGITESMLLRDVAITAAIGFVLGVLLRRRALAKGALLRRIIEYRRCLECQGVHPQACPRGPGRAVTIGQLLEFYDYFQAFIRNRDMYYTCNNLIKPLTKEEQLSYAELVGPSKVVYFVSHYWGSQFRHFVESIHKHAQQVKNGHDWRRTSYWICSFSNNQWNLDDELSSDCDQSSFYLALRDRHCRGTVMVLDEQALPLTRSWCLFELLQTFHIRDERSSHDFEGLELCTAVGVLSKGATGVDIAMGLAQRLTSLDLQDATASNREDKVMIDDRVRSMPGGFPAINRFVRVNIRDALLRVRDSFESDFNGIVAALDRCSDTCRCPPQGETPPTQSTPTIGDSEGSEAAEGEAEVEALPTLLRSPRHAGAARTADSVKPCCSDVDRAV